MPSYKYQTSSGKTMWFVSFYAKDYMGRNIKHKKSGFSTKRAADTYERDFLSKNSGKASSMTFREAAENYLEDMSVTRKPNTVRMTRCVIEKHLLPVFGTQSIIAITSAMVREWQNDMIASGEFSVSTLKIIFGRLSTIFNFAVRMYGLPTNPIHAAHIQFSNINPPKESLHYWTLHQFQRFITSGLLPEYIVLFMTLFWSGCRLSEALALTRGDYDPVNQTLRINKTLSIIDRTHKYIQSPKTRSSNRTIVIPKHLCDVLDDWIVQTDISQDADMFFWFTWESDINVYFRHHTADAGLPIIRIHDLRHSHVTMLIHLGFPPLLIRDHMGHKDIGTTLNIYGHLYPSRQDDLRHALETIQDI